MRVWVDDLLGAINGVCRTIESLEPDGNALCRRPCKGKRDRMRANFTFKVTVYV